MGTAPHQGKRIVKDILDAVVCVNYLSSNLFGPWLTRNEGLIEGPTLYNPYSMDGAKGS